MIANNEIVTSTQAPETIKKVRAVPSPSANPVKRDKTVYEAPPTFADLEP